MPKKVGCARRLGAGRDHNAPRCKSRRRQTAVSARIVDLEELPRAQLAHFEDLLDRRILLDGPALHIWPGAAKKLGMAFHELATNAGKYGALSNNGGQVHITWQCGSGKDYGFVFDWREIGGPAVETPKRTGFGSLVSGSMLEGRLSGSVEADYAPEGLRWRLRCPLGMVTEAPEEVVGARDTGPEPDGDSEGVLVVEDDALLALAVAEMLKNEGFHVIGPAHSADRALTLIERTLPALAVLDVNLGKQTSEPVAVELRRLGVPFLCVSAYSSDQMPDAFPGAPFLPKPLEERSFLGMVRARSADRPKGAGPA